MTPDDERPRTPAQGVADDPPGSGQTAAEPGGGDDLEALAGAIPSLGPSDGTPEADEELDLGALATTGGRRPTVEPAESETRLSLAGVASTITSSAGVAGTTGASVSPPRAEALPPARTVAPATHSDAPPSRGRPAWLMPLMLGLGIGAGAAAVVFVAGDRQQQAVGPTATGAAAQPASVAPALAADPQAAAAIATAAQPATALPPPAAAAPATPSAPSVQAASAPRRVGQPPAGTRGAPPAGERGEGASQPSASEPAAADGDPVLAVRPAENDPLATDKAAGADANAKTSSMDALLDEALSPAAQRAELERKQQLALEQDQLPLTPSKEDVTQAMTVLLPAIRGCAMGQSGLATAGIVVRNDGRVAGVEIAGAPFAGTASGRCMEGVIRRAKFTRFRQPVLRIKFPLAIQ